MAAKIRKGDKVIVLSGRDKAGTGECSSASTEGKALVRGINRCGAPEADRGAGGGIISRSPSIHLSNLAYVGKDGQTHPRRGSRFTRTAESPHAKSSGVSPMAETAYMPRLRAEYTRPSVAPLTEKFGYANVMQVPRLGHGRAQHGHRGAVTTARRRRRRCRSLADRGPEGGGDLFAVAIATFKLRENRDRLQGHAAQARCTSSSTGSSPSRCRAYATSRAHPKSFDGRATIRWHQEHIIFPEIDFGQGRGIVGHGHHGVPTAPNDDEARAL